MVATYVSPVIDLSGIVITDTAVKAVVDAIRATDVPLITGKEDATKAVVDAIRATDVPLITGKEDATKAVVDAIRATDVPLITGKEDATKAVVDLIRATDVPLITGKEDATKAVVDAIRATDVPYLASLISGAGVDLSYGLDLLNTVALNHNVQVNTSQLQKQFSINGSGWVRVSYHAPVALAGTPLVEVYDGAINAYNLIAKHAPVAETAVMILAAPAFFKNGLSIQMSGDATHLINVFVSTIQHAASTTFSKVMRNTCYEDSVDPNTNYGDSAAPSVQNVVVHIARQFMLPDLTGLPPVASVTSAKLRVYPQATKVDITDFHIHEMLHDWVWNELTWNQFKAGNPWGVPGGSVVNDWAAADVYVGDPDFTAGVAFDFDITATVNKWLAGTLVNNGLVLMIQTASATNNVSLNSKQANGVNKVPLLVITI
jgi:hypothetical protein